MACENQPSRFCIRPPLESGQECIGNAGSAIASDLAAHKKMEGEQLPSRPQAGWKQRLVRELVEYAINFLYLVVFLGAFAWYRRWILAEYRISYFNYGVAVIEAMVLAKVIRVGDALGLNRAFGEKPLIIPTLSKAFLFSLLVGLFSILERLGGGILRGKGLAGGLQELLHQSKYALLARCLVTFCAFIPFFAFRELRTLLGEGRLYAWFFQKRTPPGAKPTLPAPTRSA
jgi:hypothetical protein